MSTNRIHNEPPAINPDVNDIADRAKYGYATITQRLAAMQYQLAELAGTGKLDRDVNTDLQGQLCELWRDVYRSTTSAVRDWDTDDNTWDWADGTYSDGRRVVTSAVVDPDANANWPHNPHVDGDGPTLEFMPGVVYHIAKPG